VRIIALMLGLFLAVASSAQEPAKRKKKPAARESQLKAHQKPTPEQIRRFNELQKKR
jgi:hypothetical protein